MNDSERSLARAPFSTIHRSVIMTFPGDTHYRDDQQPKASYHRVFKSYKLGLGPAVSINLWGRPVRINQGPLTRISARQPPFSMMQM